jgi:hypothetical protein
MFSIAKNSHALQSLAVRFMAGVNPAIEHNLQKIAAIKAIKKAMYLVNLEGAPGLSPGSIILLDDFFAYRGSERKGVAHAFKEFREAHPHMNFRRLLDYGYGGQGFILADMDPAN